ncbi:ZIP family metal transporter [Candidatus Kaiserbacteria bacterium]|nr:MAG: ZIP family metal transporter [Candidatus Kaiserbacteria bacterium]
MIIELVGACLLIMTASLVGKVSVWKVAGAFIEKNLDYLVSFAAGVFLILVLFLSQEVVSEATTPIIGLVWIISGLILVWLITKLIPEGHYHYHADEENFPKRIDARKMLVGDTLHNTGDGVLLAVAFTTSPLLGFVVALSIFIHELVQEISEFFILRHAGYSTRHALIINFVTSSTILVGAIGGYFLFEQFSFLEIPVLGFATGALLALLMQDLIPHSFRHAREKKCAPKHIITALLGMALMFGVFQGSQFLLGEEAHSHGEEVHTEESHSFTDDHEDHGDESEHNEDHESEEHGDHIH